jgi:hypothetical protein
MTLAAPLSVLGFARSVVAQIFHLLYRRFATCWPAAILAITLSVHAFPPAPPYQISGMVRDEYGSPISTLGATVLLQATNGVQISASIDPLLAPGINYHLTVPMDFGTSGQAYKASALFPFTPCRLYVVADSTTNVPIQLASGLFTIGQPADSTNIDLTLGTDSVGDGIPDAWKNLVVSMFGGLVKFSDIHPWTFPPNGGQSYGAQFLAGTFPWDKTDAFKLTILGSTGQTLHLQFSTILDHVYTLYTSSDLVNWTPINFTISGTGPGAQPLNAFYAADYGTIQVDVPVPAAYSRHLYFKARVQ